jgi:plastocyanin
MVLELVRSQQMDDLVTARHEQLGDEAAVAAPPEGLGTEEAGSRLCERGVERLLPLRGAHLGQVTPEGGSPDAREALLAGLPAQSPTQLAGVAVGKSGGVERGSERTLVELRVAPGAREAPHVDQRCDVRPAQGLHQLVRRARPVPDRPHAHRVIKRRRMEESARGRETYSRAMTRVLLALGATLVVIGATACGSGDGNVGGDGGGSGGQRIEIVGTEFQLEPSDVQLDEPGTYTFVFSNEGGTIHALEVEGHGVEEETGEIEAGETVELTVELPEAGEYELYCPVGNHRGEGMEGTIVVGGGGGGSGTTTDEGDETTTEEDDGYGY